MTSDKRAGSPLNISSFCFYYQLAFLTPGIRPLSAKFRKQMRQIPNLRYTARGLPQIWQRDSCRDEYLGVLSALAILDLLATSVFSFPTASSNFASGPAEISLPDPCFVKRLSRYSAVSSVLNGMPNPRSNSRASSSESVEQHKAMFMPCTRVYLSGFNSGNTSCSLSPRL